MTQNDTIKNPLSVLIIEDSEDDAQLVLREFYRHDIEVAATCIETREEMLYYLGKQPWDIIIADYSLPRFNGLSAIAELKKAGLDIPFILVSGTIGEELAVLAMKAGAQDYIMKDNLRRLIPAVERELRESRQRKQRARAEAAAKETEESFRKIFENAPIGMAIVNRDLRFERVNEQFCQMLGYPESELLKRSILDISHPEEVQVSREMATKIFSGELNLLKAEKRYLKKNREILWAAISVSVLQMRDGKIQTTLAMLEDITERKQTEQNLLRIAKGVSAEIGKEFFRSLVENLAKALRADHAFIGQLVGPKNDRIKTISVYKKGKIVDNFEYALVHTPCKRVVSHSVCCHPAGVQKLFPKDTLLAEMQVEGYIGTALADSTGNPLGILVVLFEQPIKNATQAKSMLTIFAARAAAELEREIAEKALKESEEKFRQIVETAQEGIWTIDADGYTSYVNRKMADMLGYTPEEMLGVHLFQFMDEEGKRISARNMQRRSQGIKEIHEFRFQRKQGDYIDTLLSTNPLYDKEKKYVGALAMVTDISVIKQAEADLKKSREQLRNLSVHLQTLREDERLMIAREIHDELGQVLTALKMDLTLIERDIRGQKSSSQNETILDEIGEMKSLIDTTIGKVRKLITELRPEVLDNLGLEAALHWQVEEFRQRTGIGTTIRTRDIQLNKEQSVAVFRIFQEALTNVARHAEARHVEIKMYQRNHTCYLKIQDDGKGIPNGVLENSNTFGLLGMKERAIIFNGQVEIASKPNQGTTVLIKIPLS